MAVLSEKKSIIRNRFRLRSFVKSLNVSNINFYQTLFSFILLLCNNIGHFNSLIIFFSITGYCNDTVCSRVKIDLSVSEAIAVKNDFFSISSFYIITRFVVNHLSRYISSKCMCAIAVFWLDDFLPDTVPE